MLKRNCLNIEFKAIYCVIVFVLAALSFGQQDIPSLVKEIKPAVVTIITFAANLDTLVQGSGFFINAKGDIITNYHVVRGAYFAKAKTADGKVYPIVNVLAENSDADILQLSIASEDTSFKYLDVSSNLPQQGEHILVFGSPFGLDLSVSDGIIAAIREVPNFGNIIQMTAPLSSGSSGGPVVNLHGEVIGVATLQVVEGQNLNFAIPGRFILNLKPEKEKFLMAWTIDLKKKYITTAEELYTDALVYFWIEDYEEALTGFKEAVKHFEEAVSLLNLSEVIPDHYNSYLYIGACYREMGQHENAVWAFEKAILVNPNFPEAYDHLANEYCELGLYEEAIREYGRAISVDSSYSRSYYNLGITYLELGFFKECVWALKKVIELNPDAVNAYQSLGVAYAELSMNEEAIWACKQAIKLAPDNDSLHYNLGWVLISEGEYSQAIESFKQCLLINPDHSKAHMMMGLTYIKMGNKAAAIEEYKILKKLDPSSASELFDIIYK